MKKGRIASVSALLNFLGMLSNEHMLALLDNPGKVKQYLGDLVAEEVEQTYVVALSDTELQEQFPEFADRLPSWRKVAAALDYRGPVAWKVKKGFTLKEHAPLTGFCYDSLNYLQNWSLRNDEPTKASIVFWVPRLAEGSTSKTIPQMDKLRTELKQRYELPVHHASSFGSIALLFALILAHFKRTGERVPLNTFYAASDTFHADGDRLFAGNFDEDGLDCYYWHEDAYVSLGFFLLGVEELGQ
jgi:hypothetical protein